MLIYSCILFSLNNWKFCFLPVKMNKNMPTTERTTLDGTSNDEVGVSSVLKPDIDDVVPTRER